MDYSYTSLQQSPPTLLYDIFQHFSTMLFSKFLYKNKQKLCSKSSLKRFPPTTPSPFSKISLQHVCPTSLQWISPQQYEHNSSKTPCPKDYQTVQKDSKSLENYLGLMIDYLQLYLISTLCKHVSTGQTIWILLQRALSTCAIDVAKVCRWSSPPRRLPGWTGMTHGNANWRQPKIMVRHTVWSCCTKIGYLQLLPIL